MMAVIRSSILAPHALPPASFGTGRQDTKHLFGHFLFGANLTTFQKKQGGVRPIAVGCTLRCVAASLTLYMRMTTIVVIYQKQLFNGISKFNSCSLILRNVPHWFSWDIVSEGGWRLHGHATRLHLHDLSPDKVNVVRSEVGLADLQRLYM